MESSPPLCYMSVVEKEMNDKIQLKIYLNRSYSFINAEETRRRYSCSGLLIDVGSAIIGNGGAAASSRSYGILIALGGICHLF